MISLLCALPLPWQVGGLGDVVTGLARACLARGHNVGVMLPFYESLPKEHIADLTHDRDFDVPHGRRWDGVMRLGESRERSCGHTPGYVGRACGWGGGVLAGAWKRHD